MHVDDEPTPGLDADGRPDPAYAAALGLVPASAGRRSAAFALDAAVWLVLAIPAIIGAVQLAGIVVGAAGDATTLDPAALTMPLILIAVSEGALVVFGLVQLILHGRRGVTLGKASFGIRSVSARTFGPAGFWRIVLRVLVLWASQVVLFVVGPALCFASSTWDPQLRGRSWLDRIGGCYAVDLRRGLDPFDAKALRRARRAVEAPPSVEAAPLPSLASDRPHGDVFLIPAERSSSGVVSAGGAAAGWTPPPIGPGSPTSQQLVPPPASSAPERRLIEPMPPGILPATPAPPAGSSQPAPPAPPSAPPAPPSAPSASRISLVFDDGAVIEASAFGLLGRAPAAAPDARVQLVPVADPSKRISKVHAEFGVGASGFWITDRGSTNGTEVVFPDGRVDELVPGVRTPLPPGARVVLGGRSFTITSEPGR